MRVIAMRMDCVDQFMMNANAFQPMETVAPQPRDAEVLRGTLVVSKAVLKLTQLHNTVRRIGCEHQSPHPVTHNMVFTLRPYGHTFVLADKVV